MNELLAFRLDRDVVRVSGPDALSFLQGQLSQDIEGVDVGGSVESLILQPQGKVDAYVRVTRSAADEVLLDVEGGYGEAVLARLNRFKLRIKADLELLDWNMVALRGPGANDVPPPSEGLVLPVSWPGFEGADLLGAAIELPSQVRAGTPEQYESLRIQAGVPAMGRELTESTIPAEAGIVERTVSFTKGCFTGQELVARIDARGGNVPRRLQGVVLAGGPPPAVGTAVSIEGREVGVITSSAPSAAFGGAPIALAYIGRGTGVPVEAEVGGVSAWIRDLPLVS